MLRKTTRIRPIILNAHRVRKWQRPSRLLWSVFNPSLKTRTTSKMSEIVSLSARIGEWAKSIIESWKQLPYIYRVIKHSVEDHSGNDDFFYLIFSFFRISVRLVSINAFNPLRRRQSPVPHTLVSSRNKWRIIWRGRIKMAIRHAGGRETFQNESLIYGRIIFEISVSHFVCVDGLLLLLLKSGFFLCVFCFRTDLFGRCGLFTLSICASSLENVWLLT